MLTCKEINSFWAMQATLSQAEKYVWYQHNKSSLLTRHKGGGGEWGADTITKRKLKPTILPSKMGITSITQSKSSEAHNTRPNVYKCHFILLTCGDIQLSFFDRTAILWYASFNLLLIIIILSIFSVSTLITLAFLAQCFKLCIIPNLDLIIIMWHLPLIELSLSPPKSNKPTPILHHNNKKE